MFDIFTGEVGTSKWFSTIFSDIKGLSNEYKYYRISLDFENHDYFPYIDNESKTFFWDNFPKEFENNIINGNAKLLLFDDHEFEFTYLKKLYKNWSKIPKWLVGNMIWYTANISGGSIVSELSEKYKKPKIQSVYSWSLMQSIYMLKTGENTGPKNNKSYFILHFNGKDIPYSVSGTTTGSATEGHMYKHDISDNELCTKLSKKSLNENRSKKYTFLTRRQRLPRFMFLAFLHGKELLDDGHVSFPLTLDESHKSGDRNTYEENKDVVEFCRVNINSNNSYSELYMTEASFIAKRKQEEFHRIGLDIVETIENGVDNLIKEEKLPLIRDTKDFGEWDIPDNYDIMWENFTDSYLNFVFETGYLFGEDNHEFLAITEKTWNAVLGGQLFLPYSWYGSNGIKRLEELGFKRFKGIDYSYDESDISAETQFRLYCKEAERLLNMSLDEIKQLWLDNKDIIEHNLYTITHFKYPTGFDSEIVIKRTK